MSIIKGEKKVDHSRAELDRETVLCGLVMPISPIDGCSSDHWSEVKEIIVDAVELSGSFDCTIELVSEAENIGIIQKRIVQNLYSSDIVICDVSAKNPNVMFELGMRLAFDKPTVIVKDDCTDYSFDTAMIEHLEYPRDLRFSKIQSFKAKLTEKVDGTLKYFKKNPTESIFLKSFGKFTVAKLDEEEISSNEAVLRMLTDLQSDVVSLRREKNVKRESTKGKISDWRDRAIIYLVLTFGKSWPTPELAFKNRTDFIEFTDAPSYFRNPEQFETAVVDLLEELRNHSVPPVAVALESKG